MRLSTKGRYAVMAMTDLALNGQRGENGGQARPTSLSEIAERQQISLSYLEQLFARLRRAGLVKSARGPGGGYSLARPSAELYVSEIVLAVDEPIKATRCAMTSNKLGANKRLSKDEAVHEIGCMPGGQRCLTHYLWEDLGVAIHDYLSQVSLEDVIKRRTRKTVSISAPALMEA
ncbi:Rrf2 family transcriptional regulator [Asticcacaulis sp. EMRT-3]|uniref:Rrf2 family transcriptional regulator n=1 Tax=Asticcacaulis sp. EMRT-3 TaxID=3040349 RepID=UPI0024AE9245|nr:Rrf2 family transcriptional regulator [Asticcacaulis sp. EMRT-3]MDI7774820.1 Rrf2 family transcriptional regulator [Asticcacaulis sp. EMRT-3]